MRNVLFLFLITLSLLLSVLTYAEAPSTIDQQLQALLQHVPAQNTLTQRIAYFSKRLLNSPYMKYPLGEGETGRYDQQPLYRLDAFDCQSYVETVLALARSSTFLDFQRALASIRYRNGQVDFFARNHFIGMEWIHANEQRGLFTDITTNIVPTDLAIAQTLINRQMWYKNLNADRIHLPAATKQQRQVALQKLHQEAHHVTNELEQITYIPLAELIADDQIKHNYPLINSIPSGAIILIIHPNWNLKNQIGTYLNVSHMGFAIKEHHFIMFRHASLNAGKVSEVPLASYLQYYGKHPAYGVAGITILLPNDLSQARNEDETSFTTRS